MGAVAERLFADPICALTPHGFCELMSRGSVHVERGIDLPFDVQLLGRLTGFRIGLSASAYLLYRRVRTFPLIPGIRR